MIDQDLVTYIRSLNTGAQTRVYVGNAPQGVIRPFVVIRRTGGNTPRTLGGVTLFQRSQFTINVIVSGLGEGGTGGYQAAMPIANTICDSLKSYTQGTMGSTTVEGVRVVAEPSDVSEIDGDNVIRWLTQEILITHR